MIVKYSGTSYQYAGSIDFVIEFLDPCVSPNSITPTAQTNPPDYYYDGHLATILNPFTTDPALCSAYITYSCSNTGTTDLCGLGAFDTTTGNYGPFQTHDMNSIPPGTYDFTISGTLGDKSA